MRILTIAATALSCLWASSTLAVQTPLALRAGAAMLINGGYTTQTIETTYGTNLATLQFSNTTSYDFYSPPLSSNVDLLTSDKGGGQLYMRNTSTTTANDFTVRGQIQFFNYDPTTGSETLIVDTTASGSKNVNHGQTVNWALPNTLLSSNMTIAAGHMVHIKLLVNLVSGTPGSFGQVLYNGPTGPSSAGFLPQNRSAVLSWSIDSSALIGNPSRFVACSKQPDGTMGLTLAGVANTSYLIEATTTVATGGWTTIATNATDSNGLLSLIDTDATNYPSRFYRAQVP